MNLLQNAKIQRWGNGLGLRISGIMREVPHFEPGAKVTVEVFEDGFTVKKVVENKSSKLFPFTEEQLLSGLDANTAHADELPILQATDIPDY